MKLLSAMSALAVIQSSFLPKSLQTALKQTFTPYGGAFNALSSAMYLLSIRITESNESCSFSFCYL